jgi:3-deoxy-7-phosphoheptulonate synthase
MGGLHFELTGDDVSECIGGATDLKVEDLNTNYETYCDPRLNYSQSMEMTFLLAELLESKKE